LSYQPRLAFRRLSHTAACRRAGRHNAGHMFSTDSAGTWHLWHWVTRLGEAQVVVPLTLLIGLSRARNAETAADALRWIAALAMAVLLTAASKVAFIGWGIGSAALDFTGISGHAMFAAAVYPVLFSAIAPGTSRHAHAIAIAAGSLVAILVGTSRVVLGTHSVSEILAGWLVGGVACAAVLARRTPVPAAQLRTAVLVTAALWLTLMPGAGPTVDTHSIVTRLALKLSGHERPYTRTVLLRSR
jgi:membrane-associated phospholipid phosphatase